jgi:hypothetical protein
MPNPEEVRRDRIESSERNAANCQELAAKVVNEEDRQRWLTMREFWLDRARSAAAKAPHQLN